MRIGKHSATGYLRKVAEKLDSFEDVSKIVVGRSKGISHVDKGEGVKIRRVENNTIFLHVFGAKGITDVFVYIKSKDKIDSIIKCLQDL